MMMNMMTNTTTISVQIKTTVPNCELRRRAIMNGYPQSDCYQDTILHCLSCSKTIFIISPNGCENKHKDACMDRGTFWFRVTNCTTCSNKMMNMMSDNNDLLYAHTLELTNSPAYNSLATYLHKNPRLYSIEDKHPLEDINTIKHMVSNKTTVMLMISYTNENMYPYTIEDF